MRNGQNAGMRQGVRRGSSKKTERRRGVESGGRYSVWCAGARERRRVQKEGVEGSCVGVFRFVLGLALGAGVMEGGQMELRASGYEARIGDDYYGSLEEAFGDAEEGDTVYVLKDCSVSETLAVNAEDVVLMSGDAESPVTVSREGDFSGKDYFLEGTGNILVAVDGGSLTTRDIILDGGAVLDGEFGNSGQVWDSPLVYVKGTYRMENGTVLQNNYNTDGSEGNSAARFAGAVQVMEGGRFDMRGGLIRNCYTNGSGGGVHARNGSSVSMVSGNIWNCCGMTGGAMAFFGPAEVSNMTLSGNCARMGGAVEIHHEVRISGCVVENNRAFLRGGAVGISGDYPVTLEGCLITGNSAAEGSAVSISDAGGNSRPVLRDCTITGNRVPGGYNGAIHYMGRAGMVLDGDIAMEGNLAADGAGCDISFVYAEAAPVSLGEGFRSPSVFALGGSDRIVSGKWLIDASSWGKEADAGQFVWSGDNYCTEARDGDIYLSDVPGRYILFYDANNGEIDFCEDPERYTSGEPAVAAGWGTIFPDGHGKEGCIFTGWNTKADGTGTDYREGEEIYLTDNLWLYAMWKEGQKVTVTFIYNGGSGEKEREQVLYGSPVVLPDASREGYVFRGWYEDEGCSVLAGAPGEDYIPGRDRLLYAGWVPSGTEGGNGTGGEGSEENGNEGNVGGEGNGGSEGEDNGGSEGKDEDEGKGEDEGKEEDEGNGEGESKEEDEGKGDEGNKGSEGEGENEGDVGDEGKGEDEGNKGSEGEGEDEGDVGNEGKGEDEGKPGNEGNEREEEDEEQKDGDGEENIEKGESKGDGSSEDGGRNRDSKGDGGSKRDGGKEEDRGNREEEKSRRKKENNELGEAREKDTFIRTGRFPFLDFFALAGMGSIVFLLFFRIKKIYGEAERGCLRKKRQPKDVSGYAELHRDVMAVRARAGKKERMALWLFWVGIVLLFISLSGMVIFYFWEKGEAERYREIAKACVLCGEGCAEEETGVQGGDGEEGMAAYDWEALCSVNPDTAGWLYLPGGRIDLPVAGAKDNEFYLSHDFTGAASRIGCLFMDRDTDSGDFNRVIYGHNMGTGSEAMFSTLLRYGEEEYFRENRFLYFADVYGNSSRYEVMAVIKYDVGDVTEWDFRERNFGSAKDREAWMGQIQERALYFRRPERGVERMITLSTCDRREYGRDGRFLVFASESQSGKGGG